MGVETNAFCTLSDAYRFLGLSSGDSHDDLLESLINAISAAGRQYLGYDPYPTDYVEWHDGDGQDCVICTHWPIIMVNALSDDGSAVGAEGTDYHVYPESGLVRLDGGAFTKQRRGIYVFLQAGLSPWPSEDLRQAACEWLQAKFSNRGTKESSGRTVKSERWGDYSVTYDESGGMEVTVADMPRIVKAVLDRYRQPTVRGVK